MFSLLRVLLTASVAAMCIDASPLDERTAQIKCTKKPLLSAVPRAEFTYFFAENYYLDIHAGLKDSAGRPALAVNRNLKKGDSKLKSIGFSFYPCNSTNLNYTSPKNPPVFPPYNASYSYEYTDPQYTLVSYYGQLRYQGKCLTLERLHPKAPTPLVLDTCLTVENDGLKKQYFQYQKAHGYYGDGTPYIQNTIVYDGGNYERYQYTNFTYHGQETYGVLANSSPGDGQVANIFFGPDSPGSAFE
ncbi:hypothetical protein OC861_002717 [Tilletia horrida]|nr:hypothetical protein OC861_002717 [Tilletia horrida]